MESRYQIQILAADEAAGWIEPIHLKDFSITASIESTPSIGIGSLVFSFTDRDNKTEKNVLSLDEIMCLSFGKKIVQCIPKPCQDLMLSESVKQLNIELTFDNLNKSIFAIKFADENIALTFLSQLRHCKNELADQTHLQENSEDKKVAFSANHLTDSDTSSTQAYFQYYGKMANQMNMLQDNVRTSLYKTVILQNSKDFKNKVVMDVGAGSGILSFFAAEAGASTVYAIEASSMAEIISILSEGNPQYKNQIKVIKKTIEDISSQDLCEKVDVLVSEPIGTFIFNERMIETYLYARDFFLKPGGKMFPNKCTLAIAPFQDHALYMDISSRSQFWNTKDFYGLDLSKATNRAYDEQFRQPVVDCIDPAMLVCNPHYEEFNFFTIPRNSLEHIHIPLKFQIHQPCLIHGLAGWFDVLFEGTENSLGFSTSPWCPPTHWYQIRFLLKNPLGVNCGQVVTGFLTLDAHRQQSYNIGICLTIEGTNIRSENYNIDLKEPDYRYYTNPSMSEAYAQQMAGAWKQKS